MAHTALGLVTNEAYNTSVDKTLTLSTDIAVGGLVVVFSAGYSNGAPTFVGISDSKGNAYDSEHLIVADGSKWMALGWAQVTNKLSAGDTILVDWNAPTPQRSLALARGYTGLLADEVDVSANYNGFSSNYPAAAAQVSLGGAGRFIGFVFYPTEYDGGDFWENGASQTYNKYDASNVDMFSVGERAFTGSGSIIPENSLGFSSQWIIMGVTFEEGTPVSGLSRAVRTVWF